MTDKILRYVQRARLPDYPCHARYRDRHGEVHKQRTNSREDVGRVLTKAIAEQRKKGGKLSSKRTAEVHLVFYNGLSFFSLDKIKLRA